MVRKLIAFHDEDMRALVQLAEDKSSTLQELLDEAVRDLLRKHKRPTNLRDALRESASEAQSPLSRGKRNKNRMRRTGRGNRGARHLE